LDWKTISSGIGVGEGADVGVGVCVAVAVDVGTAVFVGMGVAVEVGSSLTVMGDVSTGVGVTSDSPIEQAHSRKINILIIKRSILRFACIFLLP
jgi:hypothetical protein